MGQARREAAYGGQAFGVPHLVLGFHQLVAGMFDTLLHIVEMFVEGADLVAAVGQRGYGARGEIDGVHGTDKSAQGSQEAAQHQPEQQQHSRGHHHGK